MESTNSRRIPRPWLLKKRNDLDADPVHMAILDKPQWKISWNKLSSCFCIKDQSVEKPIYDEASFCSFPPVRRNSSCSFSSYGSDDSGSVSSFTESDTFSYSTEEEAERFGPRRPPRASTPPPAPISKPPTISARSRSAGLPPLNPSSSIATPQAPMNRSRCDTGDNTRTSATTNTSRHRRLKQFQFSSRSMEQIWKGPNEKVIPPSFVLCEDMNLPAIQSNVSWATNSFDMEDGHANFYNGWNEQDGDGDGGIGVEKEDEESASPFAQLDKKLIEEAWDEEGRNNSTLPDSGLADEVAIEAFEYLPKHAALETAEGTLVLSGWIAVSLDNGSLKDRLRQGFTVRRDDIFYMRIVEQNGQASITLQKSGHCVDHVLTLRKEWVCSSLEISSRVGRCVVIRSIAGDVATLLPVSLGNSFFHSGELVPTKQFSKIRDRLFASGQGKVYAPDAQHDAAMYILFSLDALIKSR